MRKFLIKLLIGLPRKGEPIYYTTSFTTTMPVKGVDMAAWEKGEWSIIINKK